MIIAAIDPGLDGALAVYDLRAGTAKIADTPATPAPGTRQYLEAEMVALLREYAIDRAVIERQQAFPTRPGQPGQPERRGQGASSAFNMGIGFGLWRGMLGALSIPYEIVSASQWTKQVGLPTGGNKDTHRALAQRLFPANARDLRLKKHDGRADALLLAHWLASKYAVASTGG